MAKPCHAEAWSFSLRGKAAFLADPEVKHAYSNIDFFSPESNPYRSALRSLEERAAHHRRVLPPSSPKDCATVAYPKGILCPGRLRAENWQLNPEASAAFLADPEVQHAFSNVDFFSPDSSIHRDAVRVLEERAAHHAAEHL